MAFEEVARQHGLPVPGDAEVDGAAFSRCDAHSSPKPKVAFVSNGGFFKGGKGGCLAILDFHQPEGSSSSEIHGKGRAGY